MNTFGPPKRVFVRGEGRYVWDADGREHLDLLSGLAVNALGHAHPTVLSAITGQIATLGHVSNFFTTPAQVALAERLDAIVGRARARRRSSSPTPAPRPTRPRSRSPGRPVGPRSSRPRARSTVARWVRWRSPTTPSTGSRSPRCPGEVIFVPYGDADALAAAVDDETAAVVLEPIQGENGIVVPPADYLAGPGRSATRTARCSGSTRCRPAWAAPAAGWCTSTKASGPTSSRWPRVWATDSRSAPVSRSAGPRGCSDPGSHGSTFGGNPVAAIAGLAVIAVIERDGLLASATPAGRAPRHHGHRPSTTRWSPASAAGDCCGR